MWFHNYCSIMACRQPLTVQQLLFSLETVLGGILQGSAVQCSTSVPGLWSCGSIG